MAGRDPLLRSRAPGALLLPRRRGIAANATAVRCTLLRAALSLAAGLTVLLLTMPLEAQQAPRAIPRVGYVSGASDSRREEAFREGLRELGYVDRRTIVIEYRFAAGRYEQLPVLVGELVKLDVAVIVAATTPAIQAAQRATRTIPIVMTLGEAAEGTIASHAHPGGNITGLTTINTELIGKRLELLKEARPRLSRVAVLLNPSNPISAGQRKSVQEAGHALRVQVQLVEVRKMPDIDVAIESAARERADALLAMPDQLIGDLRQNRLPELAIRHRLPTMFWGSGFTRAGALMGYGPDEPDVHRRAASYVDKILKGASPGDLPVEQPSKFEFAINLKIAKTLGLTIPQSLLLRATEVIQ